MNIVVLNDSCEVDGGAAMIAIEDAREMAGRGHRVIFFSACGTPPREPGGIEWISLGQRTILDEPNRLLAMWRGLWNSAAYGALRKLLLTLPRDNTVVHLHSWSKALSGSVVSIAHKLNYRLVCTLHDYFLVCRTVDFMTIRLDKFAPCVRCRPNACHEIAIHVRGCTRSGACYGN